jgi:hypothetical protein
MSDIEVGDMVMIVRPAPCGCIAPSMGVPWTVRAIYRADVARCPQCWKAFHGVLLYADRRGALPGEQWRSGERSMLIKINPPAREDEQPAPPVELPEVVA